MELVYLWVEDYKNIRQQGFNFSGRYRYDYNPATNKLTIIKNMDYVHIFPENINVTAIVGENGSGKSSLFEFLNSLVQKNYIRTIAIYQEKNRHKILCINRELVTVLNSSEIDFSIEQQKDFENDKKLDHLDFLSKLYTIVYSSSPFDHNFRLIGDNRFSYLGFFQRDGILEQKKIVSLSIENIIYFLKNTNVKELELLKINISKDVLFTPISIPNDQLEDIYAIFENAQEIINFTRIAQKNRKYNDERPKRNFLLVHFWLYLLQEEIIVAWKENNDTSDIANFFNVLNMTYDEFIEKIQVFLDENGFLAISQFINKVISIGNKELSSNMPRLILFRDFWINVEDIDNDFLDLFKRIEIQDLFELSWIIDRQERRMSAGEIVILDILGKLYRILNMQAKEENFIFLFDEIESLLHPEWQRKYMYLLLKLIELHSKATFNQILFITHSPFILSDIPKENVIFLEKGKQVNPFKGTEQTFGANIHTLLSHGFFMKDGLMGEFAKEKINQIINYLNDKESEIIDNETAQKYINIIGEPILKRQLQKMLDSKRISRIDEIDELRKRIALLESKQ